MKAAVADHEVHEPRRAARPARPGAPSRRLVLLGWAFTVFNSLRVLAYLPTIWALHDTRSSDQHSLWTWTVFLGANLTMAMWLHAQGDRRARGAVLASSANAVMCVAVVVLILVYR